MAERRKKRYLGQVVDGISTTIQGLRLSGRHLRRGFRPSAMVGIDHPDYFKLATRSATIQYPAEQVPVPDNGRYRLHMETDDCIGCDKCARICPVDCITIETFRADGDLGRTSDGTVKRLHLPVFDIDMGKCMYCGLCTTVCPTECLTMTKVFDYSTHDRDNLVFHFGAMSPEEEQEKRTQVEAALAAKKAAAAPPPPAPDKHEDSPPPPPATGTPPVRRKPIMVRKPAEETPSDTSVSPPEDKPADPPPAPQEAPPPATPPRRRPIMVRKPPEPPAQDSPAADTPQDSPPADPPPAP